MQPLSFTAGKKVGFMEKTAGESAGGLFSGQSGPKPPPALSVAVLGMKPGGKRSVSHLADLRLLLQDVDLG
jgi:peptidylprolyl isomerase